MSEETNGTPQEETQDNIASTLASAIELQEAPASWNVRYYDGRGYECQLTLRDFTAAGLLPRTVAATEWLEAHGCTARLPRNGNGSAPAPANAGGEANAPTCQYHGPMKKSQYGGWYCPSKMGDGSYCKEQVKDG